MSIEKEPHLPVIEAREILTRIENGDPVIYDHVSIAGDIDISRLDLPLIHEERAAGEEQTALVVASKIQIRNCEFQGDVNFAHALLQRSWTCAARPSERKHASKEHLSRAEPNLNSAASRDTPHFEMPISPDRLASRGHAFLP